MSASSEPIPTQWVLDIARVCHDANRAWCEANGDNTQMPWDGAEEWQRASAVSGVLFALGNPDAPDSAQHDAWMADKRRDGWTYGETKDATAKTHPCMVSFDALPPFQRKKDALFRSIVRALANSPVAGVGGLKQKGCVLLD